jgi:hypothetical protein
LSPVGLGTEFARWGRSLNVCFVLIIPDRTGLGRCGEDEDEIRGDECGHGELLHDLLLMVENEALAGAHIVKDSGAGLFIPGPT